MTRRSKTIVATVAAWLALGAAVAAIWTDGGAGTSAKWGLTTLVLIVLALVLMAEINEGDKRARDVAPDREPDGKGHDGPD